MDKNSLTPKVDALHECVMLAPMLHFMDFAKHPSMDITCVWDKKCLPISKIYLKNYLINALGLGHPKLGRMP
jgi:hypothetical protein